MNKVKKKSPPVKKVQAVSFPRSGHHLLADCLCRYFGKDLSLTTDGKKIFHTGAFFYCEYYKHCRQTPCTDPKTTYQKNHDIDLTLENRPAWNYIIQYRDPIESLVSYYCLETNPRYISGLKNPPAIKKYRSGWVEFAEDRILYWKKFIWKWVIENKNKNTAYVSYESLLANPHKKIKEVIQFINPERPVNAQFLREVVKSAKIKRYNNIKRFRYFDPSFFRELREKVKDELRILRERDR